ncbi:MAG: helix-turn-helix domain-containing protein [Loktanella sp.]|nr:helix-turn-helix domain-containing protein [Loktanella sp.]
MSCNQYWTVKEIADLLKVSEVIVRRWIKDGELRAIDIGKGWRVGSDDLDAFLEGHATRPAGTSDSPVADPVEFGAGEMKGKKT